MAGLTEAQRAMLSAPRRDGEGNMVRHSLANAGRGNRVAVALERKGLVDWRPGYLFGGTWHITHAGREALSSQMKDTNHG